jgi:hypothetical protein
MPWWLYRTTVWLADREPVAAPLIGGTTWVVGYVVAGWRGVIVAAVAQIIGAFLMMLRQIREANL